MSIRLKTLLLIAGTTVVLFILLYSLSLAIVLGRFAELEKRDARRALEQALNVLGNEIGELDTFNHRLGGLGRHLCVHPGSEPGDPGSQPQRPNFSGPSSA